MVAYNFNARFADSVTSGRKRQTIRRNGKRRHARPGERLQLYTGMRQPGCRKLLNPDPVCTHAFPIRLWIGEDTIDEILVDDWPIQDLRSFAQDDGFRGVGDMHRFFADNGPLGLFCGTLIMWEPAEQ